MIPEWYQITFDAKDLESGVHQTFESDFADCVNRAEEKDKSALFFKFSNDGKNRIYYFPRIEFYFLALGRKYPYINYSNKPAALPISIAVGNMSDYKRLFEDK